MKTEWIKLSERKPTVPFWYCPKGSDIIGLIRDASIMESLDGDVLWMPCDIPEPPPEDLTQRTKDEQAFTSWFDSKSHTLKYMPHPVHSWHAALAYERAEVLKTLNGCCNRAAVLAFEDWLRNRCAPQ